MVLVCGSRTWTDEGPIREALADLPKDAIVLHGAARGADSIADRIARELGLSVEPCPADWSVTPTTPKSRIKTRPDGSQYDAGAGVLRNLMMLDLKPNLVLAFHDGHSRGTQHTITEAKARRIPVTTYFG